jgi:Na+/H+-translocating membrane pyrophosphatase
MCSSISEEVEASDCFFSGDGHDTLYSRTCTPADLRPRITLLVLASTIILLRHSCWSADEESLSAKIELKIERAGNSKMKSLFDAIESARAVLKRREKCLLHVVVVLADFLRWRRTSGGMRRLIRFTEGSIVLATPTTQ